MSGAHLEAQSRIVVSGLDADGKSTILADGDSAVRTAQPGFTVNELWQVDSLPAKVNSESTVGADPVLDPPAGGLVVRIAVFPPDAEFDADAYAASLDAFHGSDSHGGAGDEAAAVWHETDTVDVVTIIDGELYAVTETAETLLKPGDTFVTRGVKHIWSNRTDKPVTLVATMMSGTR
ncbi:cupin domain-containing protein [Gordonia sp. PKS22-38]|uniref:Cupin domain-containing protein n=1 Tax=Gordonia prachuapensis TaxID=3115651 RepID=A0ABU7MUL7_9ACTN|nr:cupin domain-containing protein [Gordonia sp. PKS22-38]